MSVWTILFVVLLIAWIGGFTVFHVAGGLIHLLLVFAVISLILHFVLGRRTAWGESDSGGGRRPPFPFLSVRQHNLHHC
jgi:uncharacterized membrane protein YfcA